MSRADEYRRELARLAEWEPYLQARLGEEWVADRRAALEPDDLRVKRAAR